MHRFIAESWGDLYFAIFLPTHEIAFIAGDANHYYGLKGYLIWVDLKETVIMFWTCAE